MNVPLILAKAIHAIVWAFIVLAFVNKRLAYINLYCIIPLAYISYIIYKGCIFEDLEMMLIKNKDDNEHTIGEALNNDLSKYLNEHCCTNVFSPQGMLILGLILSAYRLKK